MSAGFFLFLAGVGVSDFLGLYGDSIQAGRPRLGDGGTLGGEVGEDGVVNGEGGKIGDFNRGCLTEFCGEILAGCGLCVCWYCGDLDHCWSICCASLIENSKSAATCLHFPFEYSPAGHEQNEEVIVGLEST